VRILVFQDQLRQPLSSKLARLRQCDDRELSERVPLAPAVRSIHHKEAELAGRPDPHAEIRELVVEHRVLPASRF
jgi:hypothetical protein